LVTTSVEHFGYRSGASAFPLGRISIDDFVQNTNDANRDALSTTEKVLPYLERVRDAKSEKSSKPSPGRLANQKGPRIQQILKKYANARRDKLEF
jgi:hypothetical protein